MTLLLASIAGAAEAEHAIAQGADIVDLRDATPEALRALVAAVRGRRPVSATVRRAPPATIADAAGALADAGADIVRIGLDAPDGVRAIAALARRAKIFGVTFAEAGIDATLFPLMAECGFAGVMLETRGEKGLLESFDVAALAEIVDDIHAHDMMAGFAGALEAPDVPRLLLLAPDILGFDKGLDVVRSLVLPDTRRLGPSKQKIDYRLLSARGPSVESHKDAMDHIFVHDFVLPVHIGTYARERDKPQKVRFNVDVGMARPGHTPEDMRDVFSYDVITDSIRMIVAQGHIPLVETLAERVAAAVLAHPRAATVTVRVEKLDTGSGTVGVEIARERPAEAAKVRPLFPASESEPKAGS